MSKKFLSSQWQDVEIFRDLDITIESWEFIAIMWPSGRWKTTLLNMVSWLDRSFSWDIKVMWTLISSLSDKELTAFRWKHISYIFQDFNLIDNLTVEENIDLIIDINKTKRRFTTDQILEKVGLITKKHQYPFLLSGGEKQRVAIARAFVSDTKIILADEPTGSLDEKNANNIMNILTDLWKNSWVTIIMITHASDVAWFSQLRYELVDYTLQKNISL